VNTHQLAFTVSGLFFLFFSTISNRLLVYGVSLWSPTLEVDIQLANLLIANGKPARVAKESSHTYRNSDQILYMPSTFLSQLSFRIHRKKYLIISLNMRSI
jgi:hypothetical protein